MCGAMRAQTRSAPGASTTNPAPDGKARRVGRRRHEGLFAAGIDCARCLCRIGDDDFGRRADRTPGFLYRDRPRLCRCLRPSLARATGRDAVLEATGQTFDDLLAERCRTSKAPRSAPERLAGRRENGAVKFLCQREFRPQHARPDPLRNSHPVGRVDCPRTPLARGTCL